jgi:DNA-binding HxlR family transcriptional regulator
MDGTLVCRQQFNEIPPHVEYSLTESGKAFAHVFEAIGEWSQKYGDVTFISGT